jgi:hypothetical protein
VKNVAAAAIFGHNGTGRSCQDAPSLASGPNDRSGEGIMKGIAGLTAFPAMLVFLADLGSSALASDWARVEQASAGKPYDYIVHVQNTHSIGYNPEVREDRFRLALRSLKGVCRSGRVVGDDKISTEIPGITSSRPDYVVLVKCA